METIKPSDLSKLDPDLISFISLKNGNMIVIDTSSKNEKNKIGEYQKIFNKKNLKISEKIVFSFNKEKETKKNKNDFNIVSKIVKNINFCYYSKTYLKENFSRNHNSIKTNSEFISTSTNHKCMNNVEYTKLLNNFLNQNSKESTIINNTNNYEENKEEDSINNKIIKKNKNYKERMEKLIENMNKPIVNAVISLDIPSDIPYEVSGIQKQFNFLMAQLRRKKNRHRKFKGEDNYQRYYELYKNKSSKIYNGTFNYSNNKRLKYFEETIDNEKNEKNTIDNYDEKIYRTNNVKDIILNKNFRTYKDLSKISKNFSQKEINDYSSNNHTISYLFPQRTRPVERVSFRDRVNKKVEKFKSTSTLICPSNCWKNGRSINKFRY